MNLPEAIQYLSVLADGIDPLTGEQLLGDHICNRADTIRALYTLLAEARHLTSEAPQKAALANAGKPWTQEDDFVLLQMFENGSSRQEMRAYLKRSDDGIASRLVRLGRISSREEYKKLK